MRSGVRHCVSLETDDLMEAARRARQLRAAPALAAKHGLAREIEKFLDEKRRLKTFSRATERIHGAALREFAERIDGLSARDVSTPAVERHYRALQARVAETTAQIHLRAIRAFFSWAVERRLCHENPAKAVRMAKIKQPGRLKFCTATERDDLVVDAPTDDLRFILLMGFYGGLRKNEIIEARVRWFDLSAGFLHVQNTATFRIKDNEARTIPLAKPLGEFLNGYIEGKTPEDFALRPEVRHGRGTYRYDFHRPYNDYMVAKEKRWVTAHVMRHTFASLLAQAGISIFKIAKWLGDGVAVVEGHYAHLAQQDSDIDRSLQ